MDKDLLDWISGNQVGNCEECNSWDDCLEMGICQTCIKEKEIY